MEVPAPENLEAEEASLELVCDDEDCRNREDDDDDENVMGDRRNAWLVLEEDERRVPAIKKKARFEISIFIFSLLLFS